MIPADGYFATLDEVWMWAAPHPSDPRAITGRNKRIRARIGTARPDRLEAMLHLELTYRRATENTSSSWDGDIEDLVAGRGTAIGSASLARGGERFHAEIGTQKGRARRSSVGKRSGLLRVQESEDRCTIATRGRPLLDEPSQGVQALTDGVKQLTAFVRRRDVDPEVTARRRAHDEALDAYRDAMFDHDVVDEELTAFDGWLRARQQRTPVDDRFAEAWVVRIDHGRAQGSIALALVAVCGALCLRPLSWRRDDDTILGSFTPRVRSSDRRRA